MTTPAVITAAIASSSLPNTPTTGATTAPRPNCTAPSSAAAVPAASGCRVSATAGAFGMTRPMAARMAHTGTTKPKSPPTCAAARTTKTAPNTDAAASAHTMICCGEKRLSSTTFIWVVPISAIAPAPNTSANAVWSRPNRPCRTKDAPAM